MGLKSVALVMAILPYLAMQAIADDYNTNSIVEDVRKAFQHEDLFNISPVTGMSPNATGKGVWKPSVVQITPAFAGGTWSLSLTDTSASAMKLTLNQFQDAVFGSGDFTKGNTVMPVSAGGTIIGDRFSLFVVPEGDPSLFRMSLTVKQGSISGNYIFSAQGVVQPGIVFGNLMAPPLLAATPIPSGQPPKASI